MYKYWMPRLYIIAGVMGIWLLIKEMLYADSLSKVPVILIVGGVLAGINGMRQLLRNDKE